MDYNWNCYFDDSYYEKDGFENPWATSSINDHVLQGIKLRQKKPKKPIYPSQDTFNVGNLIFSCPESKRLGSNKPTKHKRSKKRKAYSSYCQPQCSMRIAELAVPAKRRCLETWRENYNRLSIFAVERLRKYVMDEYPVVPIPEAIRSFKHASSSKKSQRKKYFNKAAKTKRVKVCKKNKIMSLCALFSLRIAHKINNTCDVFISSRLEKLLDVVCEELRNVSNSNLTIREKDNEKCIMGTSKKVTLWIDSILEEASYKLLEEDLRELEEQEGPVLDFLDVVIEKVLDICKSEVIESDASSLSFKTLESNAGNEGNNEDVKDHSDLLDSENSSSEMSEHSDKNAQNEEAENDHSDEIIKDLRHEINNIIDNNAVGFVQNRIQSISNDENVAKNSFDIIKSEMALKQSDEDLITMYPLLEPVNADVNIAERFIDEIGNKDEQELILTNENNEEHVMNAVPNNDNNPENLENEQYNNALYSDVVDSGNTTNDKLNVDLNKDVTDNIAVTTENLIFSMSDNSEQNNNTSNLENENDANVSKNILNDSFSEEKNKKVTFTQPNKVTQNLDRHPKHRSYTHLLGGIFKKKSVDFLKPSIIFSPPNKHLLSDADELWPEDIVSPVLRPSASVSKSITSLGRITELEEQVTPVAGFSEESLEHKDAEKKRSRISSPKLQKQTTIGHKFDVEPITLSRFLKEFIFDYYTSKEFEEETSVHILTNTFVDEKGVEENATENLSRKSLISLNVTIDEDLSFLSKLTEIKAEIVNENDCIVAIEPSQDELSTISVENLSKFESKSSSALIISTELSQQIANCDHGEPTNYDNDNTKETDLRKWCADLEQGYANLELWSEWISNVCDNIKYMKDKEVSKSTCVMSIHQDWTTLQENIDDDAAMWLKLNKQAQLKGDLRNKNNKG